jgi:hypothetical protein
MLLNVRIMQWQSKYTVNFTENHINKGLTTTVMLQSINSFFSQRRTNPQWARASSLRRLHDHTQTLHTFGRITLDEGSACRRDLYLTTQTLTRDRHPCPGGIRTLNPSKRITADPRLKTARPLASARKPNTEWKYVVLGSHCENRYYRSH